MLAGESGHDSREDAHAVMELVQFRVLMDQMQLPEWDDSEGDNLFIKLRQMNKNVVVCDRPMVLQKYVLVQAR